MRQSAAIVAFVAMALSTSLKANELPSSSEIREIAREAMTETGAKGLAIAVIDQGQIRSIQAFGTRNAQGEPLTVDTVMYGASLTKAVFGYLVVQLADEGKVDLDQPIAAMLPKPLPDYGNYDDNKMGDWADLKDDVRWAKITPRMALTHSTGFHNFSFLEPDQKLRIHFEPGSRYSYSGDGIILLQFGMEQGSGFDVENELQDRFFKPLGMTRTSLKWQPSFAANLADGWQADGKAIAHDERSRVRAAGSMDTTIKDLAAMAAAMVRGDGLSPKAAKERVLPQLAIDTMAQFPPLLPPAPPEQRVAGLSAGLGVVTFTGPQGPGWYKGGHDDQTGNTLVCLERTKRCVLLLGNDVRIEAAYATIVKRILGETGVPFRWEYHGQYGF